MTRIDFYGLNLYVLLFLCGGFFLFIFTVPVAMPECLVPTFFVISFFMVMYLYPTTQARLA